MRDHSGFLLRLSEKASMGRVFMLVSAFLFAATDGIIKVLDPRFTAWDIAFYRFGGGLIILLILFGRKANPFKGSSLTLFIIRGLSGTAAFLSLVVAIQLLTVSSAIVLLYSFPTFAALFSALIFGERIPRLRMLSIFGTFAGVAIMLDFTVHGSLLGQSMGLLAGVFAGFTVTIIKKLRENNGVVVIYLYFCLVGAAVTFPKFIADPIFPGSALEWLAIGSMILLFVGAQLTMNQGYLHCKSWEGGLFLSNEVVFTAILGISLFGDPVTWRFWCGGGLILGSVLFLDLGNWRERGSRK
jgi:drug/metabolite transporter (DMT)-like permease